MVDFKADFIIFIHEKLNPLSPYVPNVTLWSFSILTLKGARSYTILCTYENEWGRLQPWIYSVFSRHSPDINEENLGKTKSESTVLIVSRAHLADYLYSSRFYVSESNKMFSFNWPIPWKLYTGCPQKDRSILPHQLEEVRTVSGCMIGNKNCMREFQIRWQLLHNQYHREQWTYINKGQNIEPH